MPAVVVKGIYAAPGLTLRAVAIVGHPHPSCDAGKQRFPVTLAAVDLDTAASDLDGDWLPSLKSMAGEAVAGLSSHGASGLRVVYPVLS